MRSSKNRTYSQYTRDASQFLGKLIQLKRKERRMTQSDLAERAGISPVTLRKIEQGDLKCEIGLVFEVAILVGVRLFEMEGVPLNFLADSIDDKLALLPKRIDAPDNGYNDDF